MENEQTASKLINTNFEDNHGLVISGGSPTLHIHFGKDGMEVEQSPENQKFILLFDSLIAKQLQNNASPKYILLPVKAAMEYGKALPFNTCDGMNARYGCNISASSWSHWINGTGGYYYSDSELHSYSNLFNQI